MSSYLKKTIEVPISPLPSSFYCKPVSPLFPNIGQMMNEKLLKDAEEWWVLNQRRLFEKDSMTQNTFVSGLGHMQFPKIKRAIQIREAIRKGRKTEISREEEEEMEE